MKAVMSIESARYGDEFMVDELHEIHKIETKIEDAMWTSVQDDDYEHALKVYETTKTDLESIEPVNEEIERERKRVLSYCLMRINDALVRLERSEDSVDRAEEVLRIALSSEDRVQILRAKMALGVALMNQGRLDEAESHFTEIIKQTQDETDDKDVIQVYGWTLIVRVNILLGKSLYNQARELTNQALGVLGGIDNYAGLRTTYSLLSQLSQIEGDSKKSDLYRKKSEDYAELAKEHRQ